MECLTVGPGVCCSAARAVFTLCCLWVVPHQKPAWPFWIQQEGKGKKYGDKEKWGMKRRGGVLSCLWPERREGPRDMTDYRQGHSSRPMPRPQLSVMGAGRGMWGTERGRKQERQVLVEKKRKKGKWKKRKTLWKDSVTQCPGLCGSLLLCKLKHTMALTHRNTHTHSKCVLSTIELNQCIKEILHYLENNTKLEKMLWDLSLLSPFATRENCFCHQLQYHL